MGVECPSDFGANLVQHFIGRYSRCSRYQTVLSKLEAIISTYCQLFQYTKKLCFTQFLIRILTAYRCSRYVGRTVSAVRPIPFWASGNSFGCELPDISEVDVDLLRCGFTVLCRSFVDNDSFYECAKHFVSQLP